MRYYQLAEDSGSSRLAVETGGAVYDLTAAKPNLASFSDLLFTSSISEFGVEELTEHLLDRAPEVGDAAVSGATRLPVVAEEVWAAGVTYQISEEAREEESDTPEMYLDVYDSERPEVFFKATPSRTVGPGEAVGIRADSEWDVPEPELGIVLYRGEVVGYTIGNDMSSRSIEGDNPLYLPQAKVYDRCCAIGPCVRSAESIDDPRDLEMSMTIRRGDEVLYDDSTNTSKMVRSVEELVEYYTKHNAVPEVAVLLTGTSLVPEDDFTLHDDDVVDIEIEGIGTLTNPVTTV